MIQALLIVYGVVAATALASWAYFQRYAITRPPIGVFGLIDIAFMLAAIIVMPVLYLLAPRWLVVAVLALAAVSTWSLLVEPVVRRRAVRWTLILLLLGADIALARRFGVISGPTLAVNNLVLAGLAIGITNLWVQSGMSARAITVLGAALIGYDYIATSLLGQMGALMGRLAALPLTPIVAWPTPSGQWVGIGVGDVLLLTAFPLVMRKAYGRQAGLLALGLGLATIAATLLALIHRGAVAIFPLMTALGPLMLLQDACWRRRRGRERTTYEFRRAEPLRGQAAEPEACAP
jgi:hypothetical protein